MFGIELTSAAARSGVAAVVRRRTHLSRVRRPLPGFLRTLAVFCLLIRLALAAESPSVNSTNSASNRVSIAVFRFENATGDPSLDCWGFTADTVFRNCLREIKSLRSLPDPTLDYGLRKLQIKSGDSMSVTQAQQLGEMIEAQRVVTGSYRREADKWQLTLRVVNTATGIVSTNLSASAADWFDIRDQLTDPLLTSLGVTWTANERLRMNRHWTKSTAALDWLTRARALHKEKRKGAEIEDCGRKALAADPKCADAYVVLAAGQGTQGKISAAMSSLRKATDLNPELARAYLGLGSLALADNKPDEALLPLRTAVNLDPDGADIYARLAEIPMIEKRPADAERLFKIALQLSPFQAALHGNLARMYIMQGKRADALRELAAAEALVAEGEILTEDYLAWSYTQLNDAPAAIEHYEKLLTAAQKIGYSPKRVAEYEKDLRQLRASLKPSYITAIAPREYTAEDLEATLRDKLTSEERNSIINPLAATPEMVARAKELTKGAKDDMQKARMLFDALVGHLDVGEGQERNAAEAFAAWNGPAAALRCQEYALLYIALARTAGLHAFFVDVSVAYDGEKASHACAAVFLGEKTLLVDPSYKWFGVPHKDYKILDDLQLISEFLNQKGEVRLAQIAVNLQPDSVLAHYNLAAALSSNNRWDEAREQLSELTRLDPDGGLTCALKARLALHDKKPQDAAVFARKGLEVWPAHDGKLQYILGVACMRQDQLREARDAFRTALLRSLPDETAAQARRAIAQINEQIGAAD